MAAKKGKRPTKKVKSLPSKTLDVKSAKRIKGGAKGAALRFKGIG